MFEKKKENIVNKPAIYCGTDFELGESKAVNKK
jgi:hypothetical protein